MSQVLERHRVLGTPMHPPWPDGHRIAVVGMGCFWGAERLLWGLEGAYTTFAGYAGGDTPEPSYREVCTGRTGHAEVAAVVYDPRVLEYERILSVFWENHDPTQHHRQGNDVGPQYRSILLVEGDEQRAIAEASREHYQQRLAEAGYGAITTTIESLGALYHAEPEHQQYLARNPHGYCNHGFCQASYGR